MQLIHRYFTLQLVQVSPFTNVFPLQNYPMYGIDCTRQTYAYNSDMVDLLQ